MVPVCGEITPQLSLNSSSDLETSAVNEKEKQIRTDQRRKDLEVIYSSGLIKQPRGRFYGFPSFHAIHAFCYG